MNVLDIIILLCFLPAIVSGLRKGFIVQAAAILAVIVAVWFSFKFSTLASAQISQWLEVEGEVLEVIAFALIFLAVAIGIHFIGRLLKAGFKFIMLGWLDKLLGVVFAIVKAGLIVGLVIFTVSSLNARFSFLNETLVAESVLYTPLKNLVWSIFPYLKELGSVLK